VRDALSEVAALLEQGGVSYAVIGGHAVNAWLEPRFTADIDITVAATPQDLQRLHAVFGNAGFDVEREYGAAQPSGPDFIRLVSADASIVVEFQVAKTALQRAVISRAKNTVSAVRVATPEDLLVLKLIANRSKDRVDLEGLVCLPDLDFAYVEERCREWDIADRLVELRRRR
jgi:hypothetical protein